MQVRSLGYRTDLMFRAFDGEIVDHGDHLVIQTPSNPTFYWGNFLLFAEAPGVGDFERWRALFAREIGRPPAVGHEAYGWDTTQGEVGQVQAFLDGGFTLERMTVLTARSVSPPGSPVAELAIRPLRSDEDWRKATENQVRCREPEEDEVAYRVFKEPQMASYRAMSEAGMGEWFGAFRGEELVGDLGLFHDGEVARYQTVGTHPAYRRQGIAGNLVYHAGRHALDHFAVRTLVIVADQDSAASRLYRSVGFVPQETQVGLELAQPNPD